MKTQKITRSNLKIIHDQVCEGWQKTIKDLILWTDNKEIEIEESLILKGYNEGNAAQKKLIEKYFKINTPKSIIEQIKDMESVVKILEVAYKPPYNSPKTKEEKSINAQYKLFLICKAYNGDWTSDWKNSSEYKWGIYKYFSGGGFIFGCHDWNSSCGLSSGLHLQKKEYGNDIIKKFKTILDDYFMI